MSAKDIYKVLQADRPEEIERLVNNHLEADFELRGPLHVSPIDTVFIYTQNMIFKGINK